MTKNFLGFSAIQTLVALEFNFHWFGERTSDYQVRHYDDTIVTRKGTEAEAIFQNHIFSLPPIPPQPEKGLPEMFTNADIFIDDMIDQIHVQKQVEKLVKKNIIVVKEGQVLTYKIPPNQTYESIKDAFKAKHPKSIVLNEMKTEEIVQIFKDKNLA